MELLLLMTLGLVAGLLGGLLGIGGSVIMIPALIFFMPETSIYLAAATAMTVNPAVAVGAATRHQQNANVSWRTFWMVLPTSVVFISAAAWYSNDIDEHWLKFSFGLFLLVVLWDQIASLVKRSDCELLHTKNSSRTGVENNVDGITRTSITGTVTGAISGLLGIGGGLVRVPLLNTLCKLPMKLAIGTSSAIMFITAIVGATFKDVSLQLESGAGVSAIMLALQIIPGAIIGGWIGAKLTKILPTHMIRIVFAILVIIAAYCLFTDSIPNL